MSLTRTGVAGQYVFPALALLLGALLAVMAVAPAHAQDVARVQSCLQTLGYDPGPIDGARGPQTRGAFADFQSANNINQRLGDLDDTASVALLFALCGAGGQAGTPQEAADDTAPYDGDTDDYAATGEDAPYAEPAQTRIIDTRVTEGVTRSTRVCVDQDLYDTLTQWYGPRDDLEVCRSSCLPRPDGLSAAAAARARSAGVEWCRECVYLAGYVPFSEITRIELSGGIELCSRPRQHYCEIRTTEVARRLVTKIVTQLPPSRPRESDIAVLVGNEAYENGLANNDNAERDADAVRTVLVERLGFRPANIIDLRNARLADLERVFGAAGNPEGELKARFDEAGGENIFVYASSTGISDPASGASYLVAVDSAMANLAGTSMALGHLYENLGAIGARSITVALEADFSPSPYRVLEAPNLPQSDIDVLPRQRIPGLTVFHAADRDQLTLEDQEFGIGLYTRYFIEGLGGKADLAPIGNDDGRVDSVELHVYSANLVRGAARKSFGVEQKPQFAAQDNLLVTRLAGRARP